MNFKNLKLRTKLLVGFSAIVIIAGIIGATSYFSLKTVIADTHEIGDVRLVSIKQLLTISVAQSGMEAYENALLATSLTPEERRTQYQRMDRAKAIVDESWKIYDAQPKTSEEAEVWREFIPAWNEYMKMHDQFVALARAYERDTTQASYLAMENFATQTILPYFEMADKHINHLVEINEDKAKQAILHADENASQTTLIVVVMVVVGVVIALFLALMVTQNIMKDVGGEPVEVARIAKEVANGNLTLRLSNSEDLTGIFAAIVVMTEKLKEIISHIISGANNIASVTEQMSSTSQQLSQGASEQASSVEEISSSMEEMASNIQQNNENALQTDKISTSASVSISRVSKVSGESSVSIKTIAERIGIINDIAFQTNILALNAAVEAARAGEHGRGFAVVAAEVRKLAERSKVAADEINVLAKNSVKVTEESAQLLNHIIPEIDRTAKLVQEISAASMEQTSGASQINNAIQMLNQVTQQNAAASEELATSAEEMASQAEQLQEIISYFRVEDIMASSSRVQHPTAPNGAVSPVVRNTSNANTRQQAKGVTLKMSDGSFIQKHTLPKVAKKQFTPKADTGDSSFENF